MSQLRCRPSPGSARELAAISVLHQALQDHGRELFSDLRQCQAASWLIPAVRPVGHTENAEHGHLGIEVAPELSCALAGLDDPDQSFAVFPGVGPDDSGPAPDMKALSEKDEHLREILL